MDLSRDFRDLLELLNQKEVEYLVVGGYATSIYATPRYTKDIDIWLAASPKNAKGVLAALTEFGFGSVGLKEDDFTRPDHIIQLGYEPNRVDLLTSLKGLKFEESYSRRNDIQLSGLKVPFLAVEDLIANKSAVGRLQDLADVEQLQQYLADRD